MSEQNRILLRMLERLRAGLLEGPGINCRPHQSRQRVDLKQFEKFDAGPAAKFLLDLLGAEKAATIAVKFAPATVRRGNTNGDTASPADNALSADSSPSVSAPDTIAPADNTSAGTGNGAGRRKGVNPNDPYVQQQNLLHKLKMLTEDARVYEQDTGADVLHLGFPLLSVPPGKGRGAASTRRLLAPLALIPVTLNLKMRPRPQIEIVCRADKMDRVIPNPSLFAWLEQMGKKAPESLFADEAGFDPWREISGLARWVAETFGVPLPALFENAQLPDLNAFDLVSAPRADDDVEPTIVPAAVLGLFPINHQALIRDMEAMVAGEALDGPVRSFIDVAVSLDATAHEYAPIQPIDDSLPPAATADYEASNERLAASADPCQARAVRLARSTAGLVVHGPPGTGKSQTITNIVGDHLMRGQRVLVVCDKRTALDVVADRLSHLGLGSLVAVVHDPERDQRELYRSVREQLENLVDARSDAQAERQLARLDQELDQIRQELSTSHQLLHTRPEADQPVFHDLVGHWLAIQPQAAAATIYTRLAGQATLVSRHELELHGRDLRDLFNKADLVQYDANPWPQCAGLTLDQYLARSGEEVRGSLQKCIAVATEVDATIKAAVPPFRADMPLNEQVSARNQLAEWIAGLLAGADQAVISHWLKADAPSRDHARQRLAQAAALEQIFRQAPLDTELWYLWGTHLPQPMDLARQVGAIEQFLGACRQWYGLLLINHRLQANKLLQQYGLPAGRQSAERLHQFLRGCQARRALQALCSGMIGAIATASDANLDDDRPLTCVLDTHHRLLDALCQTAESQLLEPLRGTLEPALADREKSAQLLAGLRQSGSRVEKIEQLVSQLRATGLFRSAWLERVRGQLCQGKKAAHSLQRLLEGLPACESVLRIHESVQKMPPALRDAVNELLQQSCTADESLAVLEKLSWEHAVRGRLAACPELARLDGERLTHNVQRYRQLRSAKFQTVCAAIVHHWTERQRQRLLVSTRSRLSSEGADVRRRLTMQGDRAMRLRKVIEVGGAMAGGDPLFDLRPVWMASPETVAQIFPRLPLFDVIIFDEASQCRLEQALPVLTRGRRVVVAGDTKQLPPTRFFETAVVSSEDESAESEQDWFELQQGEVEDLLSGALNLQIEQCYLDVHYRSRNADLISFSNERFYSSRLQPIPGHPRNRTRFAPITLYHAGGVYEERTNRIEAEAVCRIVRDLLRRAEAPSIGIACFNTDQRDLIIDCLDELAAQDADFGNRLAEARSRKGTASSEGLFVKNLENVQGDERDHIVISTTYGPDPNGRFYRRFGPLGRAGGGRRLNVLVTRARHEVHLVTSIPSSVYRSAPPLAPGQTPNGAWLLFSYLAYAEQLGEVYAASNAALDERDRQDEAAETCTLPATVFIHPSPSPSLFAEAVANSLATTQQLRSQVHWGNEGFCVDIALGHPHYIEDVTIGLLCDLNRYHRADDPIEWEIFRTDVLEATGWKLQRIWSPQYFRDPASVGQTTAQAAADFLAGEDDKNTLRVAK